jgi:hypothetical protein
MEDKNMSKIVFKLTRIFLIIISIAFSALYLFETVSLIINCISGNVSSFVSCYLDDNSIANILIIFSHISYYACIGISTAGLFGILHLVKANWNDGKGFFRILGPVLKWFGITSIILTFTTSIIIIPIFRIEPYRYWACVFNRTINERLNELSRIPFRFLVDSLIPLVFIVVLARLKDIKGNRAGGTLKKVITIGIGSILAIIPAGCIVLFLDQTRLLIIRYIQNGLWVMNGYAGQIGSILTDFSDISALLCIAIASAGLFGVLYIINADPKKVKSFNIVISKVFNLFTVVFAGLTITTALIVIFVFGNHISGHLEYAHNYLMSEYWDHLSKTPLKYFVYSLVTLAFALFWSQFKDLNEEK